MRYNFDDIIDRRGSGCVKYDDLSAFGNANVIPLWIADMDFEAPEFICQAIARRAAHRVFGYGMRTAAYYAAITNWVERRNGWHIDREWIDFTPGVVAGFVFALRALSAEGDGIVIMPPVYPPFAAQIKANGRRVVENPLIPEKGYYRIDYDDLDRKLAEATVLLFCNPHNPTGRVFTAEELRRVADLCRKHDVAIVSDEIHSDLIFAPCRHTHIASLCAEGQRCITLIAPTKTFNIAGLSTSAAITPDPAAREALRTELGRYHVDQGNIFGTAALIAAYNEGEEWLGQMLDYVHGNMEFTVRFLAEHLPEIRTAIPEGTYLMWLDLRGLGLGHEELLRFMAREAGVGLNDGAAFGVQGRGFMRMNMATSRALIETALLQIEAAWRSRENRH